MEITKPCVTCGKFDVIIDKLDLGDSVNWYVKCTNCVSVSTITHATRDGAVRQWDNQFCWEEVDKAQKAAREAILKEKSTRLKQVDDARVLQYRYEKLVEAYIKYRMLYSGTAGNLNLEGRRKLMIKELSEELGWTITI